MHTALTPAPQSLIGLIQAQQSALGLTDRELCAAVGFEREIVLKLIKAGTMHMPLNRVPALAAALELDPVELLTVALRESDPVLLQVIEEKFNPLCLTSTEQNLIKHLRELSGNTVGAPIVFPGNGVIALVAV
ncbi:hypothetical protein [Rhodoferax ferrireducens]|uniref:hypothetical protein n=1 Tax=Rhodoferax ferrireducens TaxID=192843 RepID=UPI003BB5DEFC